MLQICKENWSKYKDNLKARLKNEHRNGNIRYACGYADLLVWTIEEILNNNPNKDETWNVEKLSLINDGNYQGTLLFVVPVKAYQPSSYDYLITYVEYGSCSGCDTLQYIFDCLDEWDENDDPYDKDNEEYAMSMLLQLCKDMLFNIKRPYYEKFITTTDDKWSEVK